MFLIDNDEKVLGARETVQPGSPLHVQTESFSSMTLSRNIALVIRFIKHRYCLRKHSWRWFLDTPWARNERDLAKHTTESGSSGLCDGFSRMRMVSCSGVRSASGGFFFIT